MIEKHYCLNIKELLSIDPRPCSNNIELYYFILIIFRLAMEPIQGQDLYETIYHKIFLKALQKYPKYQKALFGSYERCLVKEIKFAKTLKELIL